MTRTVVFRAASGPSVGAGHLVRCASLAEELREFGFEVSFVTDTDLGVSPQLLGNGTFEHYRVYGSDSTQAPSSPSARTGLLAAVHSLSNTDSVDWLVVDHYALEAGWIREHRHLARRVVVIDDLANRPLVGDVLVNQNYGAREKAYEGLAPASMEYLVGPRYALLGSQYKRARDAMDRPSGVSHGRSVLVSFGLSDLDDVTSMVLRDIEHLIPSFSRLDVVIGSAHPGFAYIDALCSRHPNAHLHVETRSMVDLLLNADLAIGGVGSSTWERMCLGVPILSVGHIPHELDLGEILTREGYIDLLIAAQCERGAIARSVECLLADCEHRRRLIERGMRLVDGQGARRVASLMDGHS